MKINKLILSNNNGFTSNCYILEKDNKAVVVDPGFNDPKLFNFLKNKNLLVDKIIATHGHYDHISGIEKLKELFPNAKTYGSSLDSYWYDFNINPLLSKNLIFDFDLNKLTTLKILDKEFKIIKTPGHSKGSISLYYSETLFSGDVLFFKSIGRSDLEGGNYNELIGSIKKLYTLPDNTIIYSGHGKDTTIIYEKNNNPFIRG